MWSLHTPHVASLYMGSLSGRLDRVVFVSTLFILYCNCHPLIWLNSHWLIHLSLFYYQLITYTTPAKHVLFKKINVTYKWSALCMPFTFRMTDQESKSINHCSAIKGLLNEWGWSHGLPRLPRKGLWMIVFYALI